MTSENSGLPLKQCNICQRWFEKTTFPVGRAQCRECYLKRLAFSSWKSKLKHEYGITPEIRQAMYVDQAGKCFFCDDDIPNKGAATDHDKETGFVRGLLCRPCNANWVDEYKRLPEDFQDSPLTNGYLLRGRTGDYVESIKQRLSGR